MKRPSVPLILLCVVGFLSPLIGGQLQMEASALAPGAGPFLGALLGSPDSPSLSHLLLGLLVLVAAGWAIGSRQVVPAPNLRVSMPLAGFLILLAFSVGLSSFKMTSLSSLAEWLCYGAAFYGVVAAAGRVEGPRLLAVCVFAGCSLLALRGLWEYSRPGTPADWRIFAGWQHPNVLAAMLSIGLMLGLGITLQAERLQALAAGVCSTAIGFALVLTQSKGGYLAAAAGAGSLLILLVVLRQPGRRVARLAGVALGVVALVGALSLRPQAAGSGAPLGRVTGMAGSSEQSAGVRTNLWKTSASLIRANIGGYGLNTFQFHSARPGLVMSGVQQAHNSYLQLAVEAGPIALLLLLGFIVMLAFELLRSSRKLPPDTAGIRAGVAAALVAAAAHSMVDSDLYHMGIGLVFFLLCGVGLMMSADGILPELLPKGLRTGGVVLTSLAGLLLAYSAVVGFQKSRVQGDLANSNLEGALEGADRLITLAPFDGEAHYVRSRLASSPEEAIEGLRKAADLRPSPRYFRALAQLQAQTGHVPAALGTLQRALRWDPNNLAAQLLQMNFQASLGDEESALATARRLANAKDQTFFKVRALPEQVPMEPYRAELFLAERTKGEDRIRHYTAALEGVLAFAVHVEQNVAIGTEPLDGALEVLKEGQRVIEELRDLYRKAGDEASATALDDDSALLADRLAALEK